MKTLRALTGKDTIKAGALAGVVLGAESDPAPLEDPEGE